MIGLRELDARDAGALVRIYSAEATRYLGRGAMDAAGARFHARNAEVTAAERPRTLHMLGLVVDGDLLGVVKLHLDRAVPSVSYIVRADAWGRGFATAGVREVLGLAFGRLGLSEVRASYHPDNPASGRVLEKAGFVPTGEQDGFMTCAARPPRTRGPR